MKSSALAIALSGCLLAPMTSMAGPQDRALIGKWSLTGMALADQQITCPGEFTLPPDVPDIVKTSLRCDAGESMMLTKWKSRGIYYEDITDDITHIPATSLKGTWSTVKQKRVAATRVMPALPAANYLIFNDLDYINDPQVYPYNLSKDKKTLTIKKIVGFQGTSYPVEMIFNKQQ